jgi:2-polyprenyl-3-methyl-5-hydroxy-6-metoxy-1,4-benzoquinol methylase
MHNTHAHSAINLYDRVAQVLNELNAGLVLDVGCADGMLRATLPTLGPRLIGLDASATLLRAHPPPMVRADAARLPFMGGVFDVVTALNVFYHLPNPLTAIREAHRVLRAVEHLVAATISREGGLLR